MQEQMWKNSSVDHQSWVDRWSQTEIICRKVSQEATLAKHQWQRQPVMQMKNLNGFTLLLAPKAQQQP